MRDIKFRFWDKEFKRFSNTPQKYEIQDINYYTDYEITQYTGLKDNNCNEIFEGDIVEYLDSCEATDSYDRDEFWNVGEVFWNNDRLGFDVSNRNDVDEEDVWLDIRVIGNKFQNPKLLEEYRKD